MIYILLTATIVENKNKKGQGLKNLIFKFESVITRTFKQYLFPETVLNNLINREILKMEINY
jgi:hypothetical protein